MGGLKERISQYTTASERHEEICGNDDIMTANKLNTMNDRVRERSLVVGSNPWIVDLGDQTAGGGGLSV